MDNIERELKLVPHSESLLDQLAVVEQLGPFHARGRRHEVQHNAFFDTSSHSLRDARVGFRCRVVEGQQLAVWSIKGDARNTGGVASRSEIELQLDADTPPALALSALRDAARSRGASALAESVADALASGGLPLATPIVETQTDRRIVDLEEPERNWLVELALDRMEVVGHAYREAEIEAELKHGDEEALEVVRRAIEQRGEVRVSEGSKLSRALTAVQG
ncbi:MAG: CYTH domain-containing protein [Chloroflexi bacterium]|nr:CYTH domain-containing protein [Chloroflexota bacterium]MBV9132451.1 CYTH domain-containing protein [Chloroflexota bacterium]MBV9895167.1 CYTH domain-containing protein [Chloroflexota bacterium]